MRMCIDTILIHFPRTLYRQKGIGKRSPKNLNIVIMEKLTKYDLRFYINCLIAQLSLFRLNWFKLTV